MRSAAELFSTDDLDWWSPMKLLSLWQQSEVEATETTMLLFMAAEDEPPLCLFPVPPPIEVEFCFDDRLEVPLLLAAAAAAAAAATAALLFEIRAWNADERSSRLILRADWW